MAKRRQAEQPQPGRKRTKPTEEPRSGGSYDLETGAQLQAPPEERAAERDESVTDGQDKE